MVKRLKTTDEIYAQMGHHNYGDISELHEFYESPRRYRENHGYTVSQSLRRISVVLSGGFSWAKTPSGFEAWDTVIGSFDGPLPVSLIIGGFLRLWETDFLVNQTFDDTKFIDEELDE